MKKHYKYFNYIGVTLILFLPFTSHAALTDFLVSWWTLDEASGGRLDSHGANDLTDNNTVISGTGKLSNGADFETADNDYLSITDGSQVGLDILEDMSMGAWIKFETLPPSDEGVNIMGKRSGGSSAYTFGYRNDTGNKRFTLQIYDSGDPGNNVGYYGSADLSAGVWYYVSVAYDASISTAYFYVDGSLVDTEVNGSANDITNSSGSFLMSGGVGDFTSYGFDGLIDEAAIWNKLLTSTEVTELYNGGTGLSYADLAGAGEEGETSSTTVEVTIDTEPITLGLGFLVFVQTFFGVVTYFKRQSILD